MRKCLDLNRLHFIEGDTDSAYWAISGDPKDDNKQGFKHIITDHEFYNNNIFKFMPSDFYTSDESCRPKLSTKLEVKRHEKKLLGAAIEKQGDNFIALCPKCYTYWDSAPESKAVGCRCKGVSKAQNKNILNKSSYIDVLFNQTTISGINTNLTLKNGIMSRISMSKTALSGKHTKMYTLPSGQCIPIMQNIQYPITSNL